MKPFLLTPFAALVAASAFADATVFGFESAEDLAKFTVSGDAVIDNAQAHGGAASLRLDPGARAEWKLADADGAGFLDLWVYDSMKSPKDAKARYAGPAWGVRQSDGTLLAIAELFAPYLVGDTTYTASQCGGDRNWYVNLQYLGETKRSEGWHRWTFLLDPEKGLSIALDGKDVNAARPRFDWNKTSLAGMSSIVLVGGDKGAEAWPVWVDDVSAAVTGEMKAKPTPPPPPPPVVPDTDPAADHETKLLYPDLAAHPRLAFDAAGRERLRAFAASEAGKPVMDRLAEFAKACMDPPPAQPKFLRDATDGQRYGLWRLPTVALHYVATGDTASRDAAIAYLKVFQSLPHWELGAELDSGMSAANIMIGAALAFDWLYDDLDPEFREAFRKTLWQHARAMYHGGHLCKNGGVHYWQNDPANNHRWHRDGGLALCALAAARGDASEQWLLGEIRKELDFIVKWLPEDGTSHESCSYLAFGGCHLVLALDAADRAFGTEYMKAPFFRTVADFALHSLAPGFQDDFYFGDTDGLGFYNNYLVRAAAANRLPAAQAEVDRFREAAPKAFFYAWFDLLWTDPELQPAPLDSLPTAAFFQDIGTLFIRDSWVKDDAIGAMFRCSPLGGYTLNRYRNDGGKYINVAHDDPDANSFVIVRGGRYLAETDRYSQNKRSSNFNTVLVNGVGQEVAGRAEGQVWNQPANGAADMTKMAFVTAWKQLPGLAVIEGEAAGSYLALNDRRRNVRRPALDTFRRTFVWAEGRYILVLDSLKAPSDVTFDWLMQGQDLQVADEAALRYTLVNGDDTCAFQVAASRPLSTALRTSTADNKKKPLGWKQLVASATAPDLLVASVYAPWGGEASVGLSVSDDGVATVAVRRGADTDTWRWEPAESAADGPSGLQLNGAPVLTAADLLARP